MTLKDLKQKATASELTLIEAVETLLRKDVFHELGNSFMDFLLKDLPPSREDMRCDPGAVKHWLNRITKHFNLEGQ